MASGASGNGKEMISKFITKFGKVLKDSFSMGRHLINSEEKQYACPYYEKALRRQNILKNHLLIHSGEQSYACTNCDKIFHSKHNLKIHLLTHSEKKPFACPNCEKSFRRQNNLKNHLLIHSKEKAYVCSNCDKAFHSKQRLARHLLTHSEGKPYACPNCQKAFRRRDHLKNHLLIHSKEKPYACHKCDKHFRKIWGLQVHSLVHSGEKPYACSNCDRPFKSQQSLMRHLLTHVGENPFSWPSYDTAFKIKNLLNEHVPVHSGETPNACHVRSNAFSDKQHMLSHSGEKSHVYLNSSKDFMDKENLKNHLMVQNGENLYTCTNSGRNTEYSNFYSSHMKDSLHNNPLASTSSVKEEVVHQHKCSQCDTFFKSQPDLDTHFLLHIGEKPHVCFQYGERFSNSSSYFHHQERYKCNLKNVKVSNAVDSCSPRDPGKQDNSTSDLFHRFSAAAFKDPKESTAPLTLKSSKYTLLPEKSFNMFEIPQLNIKKEAPVDEKKVELTDIEVAFSEIDISQNCETLEELNEPLDLRIRPKISTPDPGSTFSAKDTGSYRRR